MSHNNKKKKGADTTPEIKAQSKTPLFGGAELPDYYAEFEAPVQVPVNKEIVGEGSNVEPMKQENAHEIQPVGSGATSEVKAENQSAVTAPTDQPAVTTFEPAAGTQSLVTWIADVIDRFPEFKADLDVLRSCPVSPKLPLFAAAAVLVVAALRSDDQ